MLTASAVASIGWIAIGPGQAGAIPPSQVGHASAVNNRNVVVGSAAVAGTEGLGPVHAVMWQQGMMTDLGTLGGDESSATAINDRGDIVGQSWTAGGASHAFLWHDGLMTDLSTLGGDSSRALGVDPSGVVTGLSTTTTGDEHVFVWRSGHMYDTGPLPPGTLDGPSAVVACPFEGVVAGARMSTSGELTAFISSPASGPLGSPRGDRTTVDLPAPDGVSSVTVSACNHRLDLAGSVAYATSPYDPQAELWRHGSPMALPNAMGPGAPSWASGISDSGKVVGVVGDGAVYWNGTAPAVALDKPSTVDTTSANAVNDQGTIVGGGWRYPDNFPIIWIRGVPAVLPTPVSA